MGCVKIITKLSILAMFTLSAVAISGGPAGGNPFYDIRIYCEYHDKNENKNITFKLLQNDNTTVKISNSMFIRHADDVRYTVGEPTFSNLVAQCKQKIKEKSANGEFLGLKGTNAHNYESLTWYYPVKVS